MASATAEGVKRPTSLGSSPGRTHSARIVPLRNIAEEVRSQSTVMQTVTVPGVGRPLLRRHARDVAAGLSAYVQRTAATGRFDQLSVSLRAAGTLVSTVLRGHKNDIVDIEFLRAPRPARTFVLGSCDVDGVVFLWFLRRVDDPSVPSRPRELATLRSYSFFSLRRSKRAYYNRIRLAGAADSGTMVLCPNDGSDVRVIQFHCMPDPNGGVDIPVIAPPPPRQQVKVGADRGLMESARKQEAPATADRGMPAPAVAVAAAAAAAAAGGAAVAGAALAAKEDGEEKEAEKEVREEVVEEEEEEEEEEVEQVAESSEEEADQDQESSSEDEREGDREEEEPMVQGASEVFERSPVGKTRTFPLRTEEEEDIDVDEDIAFATARAAGIEEEEEEEGEEFAGEYEEGPGEEEDYGLEYEDEEEVPGGYEEGEPGEEEEYEDEYSDEDEDDDKAGEVRDEDPGRPAQRRTA